MTRLPMALFAAVALMTGAAYAQSDPPQTDPTTDTAVNPPVNPPMGAPAPTGAPMNAAATERTTPDGRPIMLLPSPTPAAQAHLLKAGDPTVISNPPVPDTPENRAKFGGPTSHGGRKTAPRGN
jgi:hypothetical protein